VPNYNEILATLETELERMIRARDKFQQQVEGVYTAIKAIQVLAQDSQEPIVEPPPLSAHEESGFTDRARSLLKANPARAFTALDVRTVMLEWSPKADPKIMLIHVHNTLKRLFKQGEVDETQTSDGRVAYRWKSSILDNQSPAAVDLMAALKKSLAETKNKLAAQSEQEVRRGKKEVTRKIEADLKRAGLRSEN
jgi:hypothetical protein